MEFSKRKSPADEARFYKRSHTEKLASLEIARAHLAHIEGIAEKLGDAKTYHDHIVVEVIQFSNQETTKLIAELGKKIQSGIVEQESHIEKYRAIIREETNSRTVLEHSL